MFSRRDVVESSLLTCIPGFSSEAANGKRNWVKLSDDHKLHKPQEYCRVMMSHPHEEVENITEGNCMLGWLDMTRCKPLFVCESLARH